MKFHLQHPTQACACGAPATAISLGEEAFLAKSPDFQCKRCHRVLAALKAGRAVFAGYDDGNGDTGARKS